MIRPAAFGYNPDTEDSNTFQSKEVNLSHEDIQAKAVAEFDAFVKVLRQNQVDVVVIDDTPTPAKPDAVFPNNWICMGNTGEITLFPMAASNRRLERRREVIEILKRDFEISNIVDLSSHENGSKFLEGTGSIVFDHINKTAYACISERTHPTLLSNYCESIGYAAKPFYAENKGGKAIYHTNVMMCVGTDIAIICAESISDITERNRVIDSLITTGHKIVEISFAQMEHFAGNMLEVCTSTGHKLLVMSTQAFKSLRRDQLKTIEKHLRIVHSPIYTIEKTGGGSARCMMAEIFLRPL